jgi:hypothetical protein
MAMGDRMLEPKEYVLRSADTARISAAIALLLALTAAADTTTPAPSPKAGHGIILTAKQARACWRDRDRYTTPATSDVQRLEASLERALADVAGNNPEAYVRDKAAQVLARMAKDVRYYYATTDGYIYVRGYSSVFFERGGQRACPPGVADGGSSVWYIRFDVKHGTFDDFQTNGEA